MLEPLSFKLEDFVSRGMLRVLKVISQNGSCNISMLSRKTGLNHGSCDRHIKKLLALGLVSERRYNNIRWIRPEFISLTIEFRRGMRPKMTVEA